MACKDDTLAVSRLSSHVQEPKSTDIGALFHAFYLISSLFGIIFSGKKVGAKSFNFLFWGEERSG
jgi:hypothetical protein